MPGKEAIDTDAQRDSEQRASEIESHKQDQLKKQKEGKAEWKRELASDSEAAVRLS